MEKNQLNWISNFIWGIADDVLRDLYVRGKYRDVILPMMVLRRLDAVLEPTKKDVLAAKANLDKAKIANQDMALRAASRQSCAPLARAPVGRVPVRHRKRMRVPSGERRIEMMSWTWSI